MEIHDAGRDAKAFAEISRRRTPPSRLVGLPLSCLSESETSLLYELIYRRSLRATRGHEPERASCLSHSIMPCAAANNPLLSPGSSAFVRYSYLVSGCSVTDGRRPSHMSNVHPGLSRHADPEITTSSTYYISHPHSELFETTTTSSPSLFKLLCQVRRLRDAFL